jgi:hypothetical protein
MSSKLGRRALYAVVVLALAASAFLSLPLTVLEGRPTDPTAAAEIAARADEHFARILAGRGLDRPFPDMVLRPENPPTAARERLGYLLFFDPVLSGERAALRGSVRRRRHLRVG